MSSSEETFKFSGDHAHWRQAKAKFSARSMQPEKRIAFVLKKSDQNKAEEQELERAQEEEVSFPEK